MNTTATNSKASEQTALEILQKATPSNVSSSPNGDQTLRVYDTKKSFTAILVNNEVPYSKKKHVVAFVQAKYEKKDGMQIVKAVFTTKNEEYKAAALKVVEAHAAYRNKKLDAGVMV
jgi:hypothetical protein